ncbi:MAG: M3 family metallopeptidase, partial [Leptospiraceae bacterium]|nr:M3 family metallopeptidase [Leptospiraceae bacterium]
SYLSYMTYGTNREYRKELEKAYLSRSPENGKIIEEILRLRSEKVKILGFKNFAELSLSTKIASSPDEVLFFLTELGKKGKVFAKKELKELKDFAKKEGHQGSLESYDRMYYAEKLKKKKFNLDEDKYRPYFEKESVTRGLLEFCGKLFGIEFSKVEVKTWHPSVLVYDLKKENRVFSRLYLDLESRKDKRGGAWLHNWQTAHSKPDASIQLASAFIVANFPASSDKQPSLLRHSDVVTLFHEMGHALQHLCSNVGECSISGIGGVEWDAVEFPSQFLENFAYNPEVLQVFARHYKTKKVLPTAMIQNLVEAKNFLSGILLLRQLEFGIFDMKIHIEDSCSEKRVQDILNEVRKEVGVFKAAGYNKFQNGFSHIFGGGYAAGYYSYKWAELLSADAYFEFLKQGIYSDIAKKYYEIILQRGGSENAMTLFRKFIGREPDVDALLRLHGMS